MPQTITDYLDEVKGKAAWVGLKRGMVFGVALGFFVGWLVFG